MLENKITNMEKLTGVVSFFKDDKGFGFIKPDDGSKDVFVHQSAIKMEGLRSLKKGDKVKYTVVDDPKGTKADAVEKLS
jgi:CspA family cold shock protein